MKVDTYAVLPEELASQVKAIDRESFAWAYSQTPQAARRSKDKFCSARDRAGHIIVAEKREVVGAAQWYRRTITVDGDTILLGGIGSLCTRKDKRKLGVGTLLLKRAMQELRRNSIDIAYLCTQVGKDWMVRFYEKAGFVCLVPGHTYTGRSGKRYTEYDGMIAPVCSRGVFSHITMMKRPLDIGRGNW